MKALKSDFAKRVLANPENRAGLDHAMQSCGVGSENGVLITVIPFNNDGTKAQPVLVNLHFVPKAG